MSDQRENWGHGAAWFGRREDADMDVDMDEDEDEDKAWMAGLTGMKEKVGVVLDHNNLEGLEVGNYLNAA